MKMENKRHSCRGKGSGFERDICRVLSRWISGGKSRNLFWRSSQSGGRATTLRKKGEKLSVHAGDIAAIDEAGFRFINTFFIECKRYKSLSMDQLIYERVGIIAPMWEKCKRQAGLYNKVPLMIVRENARTVLLITNGGCEEMQKHLRAHFVRHQMYVYFLGDVMLLDPETFIAGGEDARSVHGRPTSDRPKLRRLPV